MDLWITNPPLHTSIVEIARVLAPIHAIHEMLKNGSTLYTARNRGWISPLTYTLQAFQPLKKLALIQAIQAN